MLHMITSRNGEVNWRLNDWMDGLDNRKMKKSKEVEIQIVQ